ncbi:MAG: ankyrin repeat domain-containing protein [Sterolibacterium sp.]
MLAALNGNLQSVSALVAAGAEIDPKGWTPLIYAVFEGHVEIVNYLLTLDIDIDAQSDSGMTALMVAARNNRLSRVGRDSCKKPQKLPYSSVSVGIIGTSNFKGSTFRLKSSV